MIGNQIFQYKIISKLGEVGMGIVYKANDTKLDRLVVLKFLPPQLAISETEKARLIQEVKADADLNFTHVCIIYEIQDYIAQPFISIKYIDGKNLLQLTMNKNQISIDKVINFAIQIAEALQEAYGKGIVHGDIKSENIMLNAKNQIKVMDFGLTKLKGSLKLTKTSSTIGTVAYMSPEQIGSRIEIENFRRIVF